MPASKPPAVIPLFARDPRRDARVRRLWRTLVLLLLFGLAVLWAWNSTAEWRAVHRLPAPERQAMYQRLRDDLTSVCRGNMALQDHCRDEAQLIRLFPECDASCRELVSIYLVQPAR